MTFLQEVVDILLAYIVESFDRSTKVIDFHYPNELLQRNNWELSDDPESLDDILVSCRATLKYAIKTGNCHVFLTFDFYFKSFFTRLHLLVILMSPTWC